MAGLTDMEELLTKVPEKEIASYLREAMICYGAGAYRACVVLTHIALFEGLRQKLTKLAPVNSTAKSVIDAIEPLVANQKAFELSLVQKMKNAEIITQLESDILEQLNKQRNKAAHPSGHTVTAEEARYVFSEAIQKFLSQPIRQTSVVVDNITSRLSGPNFFPNPQMPDIELVVDQETQSLDAAAIPQLVAKLVSIIESTDAVASDNAGRFMLSLADRKHAHIRNVIVKGFLEAKSSNDAHAQLISELVSCDPLLLDAVQPGMRIRVCALLLKNANDIGVKIPYAQFRNPAYVLGTAVAALGEAFMTTNYKAFTDWVVDRAPYAPEFIHAMRASPGLMKVLQKQYRKRASHPQFDVCNPFAAALPAMDGALAAASSDEDAFHLLAAVAKGADWGGYRPQELVNNKFHSVPVLKERSMKFAAASPAVATALVAEIGFHLDLESFLAEHF